MTTSPIKLTQTVQKGGCAAKVAAAELRKILDRVQFPKPSKEVLIDAKTFDDAAIIRVSENLALVQTLDFFTPIVDTPRLFGRIAAANALSDVYAMGGLPQTAMGILAFPIATLEADVAVDVLQGAADVIQESGASFVGGHSIDDETLKFGLSVMGYVHPEKIWSNAGAKVGDILILTKAIGTGTLTAGLKRGAWSESDIVDAMDSMCQLNHIQDLLTERETQGIHAATDITGFGIAGHGLQMAQASQVHLELHLKKIPLFAKTITSWKESFLTKAHRTNQEYAREKCDWSQSPAEFQQALFDPQTSGGLLLSVEATVADSMIEKLKSRFPFASVIGAVRPAQQKLWTAL